MTDKSEILLPSLNPLGFHHKTSVESLLGRGRSYGSIAGEEHKALVKRQLSELAYPLYTISVPEFLNLDCSKPLPGTKTS